KAGTTVTSIRICHALLYARVAFRPVHNDAVLCSVGSCTEPQIVLVRIRENPSITTLYREQFAQVAS
ncbi:Os05g0352700, partial [Oryza sativa Japonica Group]